MTYALKRLLPEGWLPGRGYDAIVAVRFGDVWLIEFAGMTALDPRQEGHPICCDSFDYDGQTAQLFRNLEEMMATCRETLGVRLSGEHLTSHDLFVRDVGEFQARAGRTWREAWKRILDRNAGAAVGLQPAKFWDPGALFELRLRFAVPALRVADPSQLPSTFL